MKYLWIYVCFNFTLIFTWCLIYMFILEIMFNLQWAKATSGLDSQCYVDQLSQIQISPCVSSFPGCTNPKIERGD